MPKVLIATDADSVAEDVTAALAEQGTEVVRVRHGRDVVKKLKTEGLFSLVVLDLQIGNMGGMAVCMDIRHEQGSNRLPTTPVLMLLDRSADVFLAKRSGADGWLVKPLNALRLRRAADTVRRGESYTEHADVVTVSATAPETS